MDLLIELLREFGLPTALVVFFVATTWLREKRLAARINHLENEFTRTLVNVVSRNTVALEKIERHLHRL